MRFCSLVIMSMVAVMLSACGGSSPPAQQSKPFDLVGSWLYLGPSDGPHTLEISSSSMVYTDVAGAWKSSWTIKSYDNEQHHFQASFDSGSGSYLPTEQSTTGAYEVTGTLLTVQLAKSSTSYPALEGAGSCTGTDGTPLPDCRLYVGQN